MLIQTLDINGITGQQYDSLLAQGWFRSKGVLYKSELVCLEQCVSSVRHIRYDIAAFTFKKRHRKLLEKNDQVFHVTVSPVYITDESEELYQKQSLRFKGFIHQSLAEFTIPWMEEVTIPTLQLAVWHGEKLVALSLIDIGHHSAASILCVYDPDYGKYSLGIYTMLKEVEYLKRNGFEHYYPGYVLDKQSSFDYKLSLGACKWLGSDYQWHSELPELDKFSRGMQMEHKMQLLRKRLAENGVEGKMVYYPFFTAAYFHDFDSDLLKYPCYYHVIDGQMEYAISYDLEHQDYFIFKPYPCMMYDAQNLGFSKDYMSSDVYEMRVMQATPIGLLSKIQSFFQYSEA
jgi:arginyl-tRNA--protein-N-Asp/Glu arginylyltransferase